jgi:two-component system sensor histidine kinase KdpD
MADEVQKNPDLLLAAIQKAESQAHRGQLKVFLGMCPGVGKTYAMLEAARRESAAGRDVVIGYVETHRRPETDALTEGLETIPRRSIEYRGIQLSEMDLDALLGRRPQIALVDELAHSNAPGCRHPKRWQDIQELVEAGVHVFTTLNVQHLESRADTVRQITGAPIHETVPDSVVDDAEIELVDLPPDELLERLRSGKVYVPDRAQAAAENFFRSGNLIALREIALRLAAEHVGQGVRDYLRTQQVAGPWKSSVRLMVALSASPLSASLVRWTRRLADALQATWVAVYVETSRPTSDDEQNRLTAHLALARQLGAEVVTTTDEDVVRGLLRAARENNATQIVFGKPGGLGWLQGWRRRLVLQRLVEASGDIDVLVVRADRPEGDHKVHRHVFRVGSQINQALVAIGTTAAVTVLGWIVRAWIGYQAVALLYLYAVVLLGLFVNRGPILLAATLTALCWNFLFVPPIFTFRISGFHDSMMFAMYFLVALTTGQLTARLRLQQAAEVQRERRTAALYRLTRELANATDFPELLSAAIREVGEAFDADAALLLPDPEAPQTLVRYPAGLWIIDEKEESVATWAFHHAQPAGRFTDTLPQAAGLHLPLGAGGKISGVMALRFRSAQSLSLQQRNLLESFVRQIALVIDRQQLRDADVNAKLLAESEQLSRTLLNSVSHELRTPIAAITSATSALAGAGPLTPGQRELAAEIEVASTRLNGVVQNLLGAARLQSGHLRPQLDWCDVAELVGVVLRGLERQLQDRPVTVDVAKDLPLVRADFVLLEQAVGNLVLNAIAHTPSGTPIFVRANRVAEELVITVADRGPGIPVEQLQRVFELFYRADQAKPGGTGLGLAIVKGFVEAQAGKVSVHNRPDGGAEFAIRLPIPKAPAVPADVS